MPSAGFSEMLNALAEEMNAAWKPTAPKRFLTAECLLAAVVSVNEIFS